MVADDEGLIKITSNTPWHEEGLRVVMLKDRPSTTTSLSLSYYFTPVVLTAVNAEDGFGWVHDPHEGYHYTEDMDASPGHVHHETVHKHSFSRPQSDLHRPLFQWRAGGRASELVG